MNINVAALDAVKHAGLRVDADAREALTALLPLLDGYRVDGSVRRQLLRAERRLGRRVVAKAYQPATRAPTGCSPRAR